MTDISVFAHKQTSFRFDGVELLIGLSHGLFSSFSIDTGSQFLLETIKDNVDFGNIRTVLDTGCGTGILGLAVGKKYPDLEISLEDRDALAAAFAAENAKLNNIKIKDSRCALAFESHKDESLDLILFNIPAKAGSTVLASMAGHSLRTLSVPGTAAIVIVNTLAETWEKILLKQKAEIVLKSKSKDHTVFLYKKGDWHQGAPESFPEPYVRQDASEDGIELETVYNIPSFDQASYREKLHLSTIEKLSDAKKILIFSPGQGWTAAAAAKKFPDAQITLADRDLLALKISAYNCRNLSAKAVKTITITDPVFCPDIELQDAVFYNLDPIPETNIAERAWHRLKNLLSPDGILCVCGTSSDINHFLKYKNDLKLVKESHKKGLRRLILKI